MSEPGRITRPGYRWSIGANDRGRKAARESTGVKSDAEATGKPPRTRGAARSDTPRLVKHPRSHEESSNHERRAHDMRPLRRFWRYLVDRPLV